MGEITSYFKKGSSVLEFNNCFSIFRGTTECVEWTVMEFPQHDQVAYAELTG